MELLYNDVEKFSKFTFDGRFEKILFEQLAKSYKELMHDPIFLAGKSEVAMKEDLQVAQDLLDTLMAHRESCVGMAANMIGVRKRIIAFLDESGRALTYTVMLNPEIIKKDGAYDTEECCLSLLGALRKCKRYKTISVVLNLENANTHEKLHRLDGSDHSA